mmetsp:Transcript_17479/g.27385  ORF Transcript_17479/g.27385 Transcript_17479/m.27385 type:complete len:223 (-) Transcript_17479:1650-2318(-)
MTIGKKTKQKIEQKYDTKTPKKRNQVRIHKRNYNIIMKTISASHIISFWNMSHFLSFLFCIAHSHIDLRSHQTIHCFAMHGYNLHFGLRRHRSAYKQEGIRAVSKRKNLFHLISIRDLLREWTYQCDGVFIDAHQQIIAFCTTTTTTAAAAAFCTIRFDAHTAIPCAAKIFAIFRVRTQHFRIAQPTIGACHITVASTAQLQDFLFAKRTIRRQIFLQNRLW